MMGLGRSIRSMELAIDPLTQKKKYLPPDLLILSINRSLPQHEPVPIRSVFYSFTPNWNELITVRINTY